MVLGRMEWRSVTVVRAVAVAVVAMWLVPLLVAGAGQAMQELWVQEELVTSSSKCERTMVSPITHSLHPFRALGCGDRQSAHECPYDGADVGSGDFGSDQSARGFAGAASSDRRFQSFERRDQSANRDDETQHHEKQADRNAARCLPGCNFSCAETSCDCSCDCNKCAVRERACRRRDPPTRARVGRLGGNCDIRSGSPA